MMTEAQNQPPHTPFDQPSADGGLRQLKSAQTLVTVATIAGPLSLLIGGVVLSGVGVICALMALVKTRRVIAEGVAPGLAVYASRIRRSAVLSAIVCALALTLNAIALASVFPAMIQAIQTGDLSSLYEAYDLPQGGGVGSGEAAKDPGTSIWG